MKHLPFLTAIALCFSCCHPKEKIENNTIIASIDSIPIYETEIDSLVDKRIYQIRKEALRFIINKRILIKESERLHISLAKLVQNEIINKAKTVTAVDYKMYLAKNPVDAGKPDSLDVIKQLIQIKREERQAEYTEALKKNCTIDIALRPKYFSPIKTDSIISYNLNEQKSGNITVYAISDYECTSCQHAEPKLKDIIERYKKGINFRYVYYSSYIAKSVLASDAANKQGEFSGMHNLIFDNSNKINNDSIYLYFAKKLNLNIEEFKKDMSNPEIIKMHIFNTKKLTGLGIYSTPTFVVNNKLVNEDNSINFLEAVIQEELKNHE
jgi:protein-disulfide isomerase